MLRLTPPRICGTIIAQMRESDSRHRILLERRISSLTLIPLTEDEILKILPAFQELATNLENQLDSPDTESQQSASRRCISSITLEAAASNARVCVRELPSLLGILDVGPKHKMDILTIT